MKKIAFLTIILSCLLYSLTGHSSTVEEPGKDTRDKYFNNWDDIKAFCNVEPGGTNCRACLEIRSLRNDEFGKPIESGGYIATYIDFTGSVPLPAMSGCQSVKLICS